MKRKRTLQEDLSRKVLFRLPESTYKRFKRLMIDYDTSMQNVLYRFVEVLTHDDEELMELIGVQMPDDD